MTFAPSAAVSWSDGLHVMLSRYSASEPGWWTVDSHTIAFHPDTGVQVDVWEFDSLIQVPKE